MYAGNREQDEHDRVEAHAVIHTRATAACVGTVLGEQRPLREHQLAAAVAGSDGAVRVVGEQAVERDLEEAWETPRGCRRVRSWGRCQQYTRLYFWRNGGLDG